MSWVVQIVRESQLDGNSVTYHTTENLDDLSKLAKGAKEMHVYRVFGDVLAQALYREAAKRGHQDRT